MVTSQKITEFGQHSREVRPSTLAPQDTISTNQTICDTTTVALWGVNHDCEFQTQWSFGWCLSTHSVDSSALTAVLFAHHQRAQSRLYCLFALFKGQPRCCRTLLEEVPEVVRNFWDDETTLRLCVEIPYLVSECPYDIMKVLKSISVHSFFHCTDFTTASFACQFDIINSIFSPRHHQEIHLLGPKGHKYMF